MYIGLLVTYSLSLPDFNENWFFSTGFRKNFKCQISWRSVHREPSCSMHIDKFDEAFCSFAKAPNNSAYWRICRIFPSFVCQTAVQISICIWGVLWPVLPTPVSSIFLCGFRGRSSYWKFLMPTYQIKFTKRCFLAPTKDNKYFWIMPTGGRNLKVVFFFRPYLVVINFIRVLSCTQHLLVLGH
jgi:hypothetical protein